MIVKAARCKKCGSTIWSKHRHDMVWCLCKSVAIDGGRDYLRLLGLDEDIEITDLDVVDETRVEEALGSAKWRRIGATC